jgi:hypothetical protein
LSFAQVFMLNNTHVIVNEKMFQNFFMPLL